MEKWRLEQVAKEEKQAKKERYNAMKKEAKEKLEKEALATDE